MCYNTFVMYMDYLEIEKSIIKKFRKTIWINFVKAIKDYSLIKENDKIAVCISGGKDSFLLAKCMEEIKKHGKYNFELVYICMNPGYKEKVKNKIIENAKKLNIKLNFFEKDVFPYVSSLNNGSPCYLCARMRRGSLYNYAKSLGCNKIALGHHFDDAIETTLMSILYNGEFKTMMPKVKSTNFENMELIRPLYYIKENDILSWVKYNKLDFIHCECPLSENKISSKRQVVKELIHDLKLNNINADVNIMSSLKEVNLDTIISYKKDDKIISKMDD